MTERDRRTPQDPRPWVRRVCTPRSSCGGVRLSRAPPEWGACRAAGDSDLLGPSDPLCRGPDALMCVCVSTRLQAGRAGPEGSSHHPTRPGVGGAGRRVPTAAPRVLLRCRASGSCVCFRKRGAVASQTASSGSGGTGDLGGWDQSASPTRKVAAVASRSSGARVTGESGGPIGPRTWIPRVVKYIHSPCAHGGNAHRTCAYNPGNNRKSNTNTLLLHKLVTLSSLADRSLSPRLCQWVSPQIRHGPLLSSGEHPAAKRVGRRTAACPGMRPRPHRPGRGWGACGGTCSLCGAGTLGSASAAWSSSLTLP